MSDPALGQNWLEPDTSTKHRPIKDQLYSVSEAEPAFRKAEDNMLVFVWQDIFLRILCVSYL